MPPHPLHRPVAVRVTLQTSYRRQCGSAASVTAPPIDPPPKHRDYVALRWDFAASSTLRFQLPHVYSLPLSPLFFPSLSLNARTHTHTHTHLSHRCGEEHSLPRGRTRPHHLLHLLKEAHIQQSIYRFGKDVRSSSPPYSLSLYPSPLSQTHLYTFFSLSISLFLSLSPRLLHPSRGRPQRQDQRIVC